MQATSPSTIGMDLEDFRRLGVRPHETRLAVIRLAALRNAKVLAEKQLEAPSQQVGVQLSKVATSAYRLLDPRQREDEIQRAHVGRILPNTLNWAGQTKFQDSFVRASVDTAFSRDSLTDMELIAMLDLDGPPRYVDEVQSWTASLSDEDLLARAFRPSARDRLRSYLGTPWVLGAVAGLAFGAMLGLATLRPSNPRSLGRVASGEQNAGAAPGELQSPSTTEPTIQTAADGLDGFESQSILDPMDLPAWKPSEMPPEFDLLQPTEADLAPIPPLEAWLDRPENEPDQPGAEAGASSPTPAAEASVPSVAPAPSKTQRRAARRRLKSTLPQLEQTPIPNQVASRIEQLEALQQELQSGSPDHWVAQMMIAELAWLVEDGRQVNERLKWLAGRDGVPRSDLLSQSFVAACGSASLPETHQHLLENGLAMADRLLADESFEACQEVLAAIAPSAETLESERSLLEIENLSQGLYQATRLAQAARRWLDESGAPIPGSDIGVLGRYYCLMLRKWDVGLPWLTEVSDARIAHAARQEMELRDSPAPGTTIEVCRLWLSVADRCDGRVADSIRLHAVGLMQDAISQTSGLKKLELERAMEQAQGQLPSYLR